MDGTKKNILSKVTETQKGKHHVLSQIYIVLKSSDVGI